VQEGKRCALIFASQESVMTSEKPVVLITGSEGRIGRAIAAALGDGFTVVGFEQACPPTATACIEVDITADEALAAACRQLRERYGERLASVIHLAAYYDFSGDPDPRYEAVNVDGTRRLLHALQDFQVEQFVYASTMLVHRPGEPGIAIDEDSELAPKWPYPQSKAAAEEVIRRERGHLPTVILRIAGVYTDDCEVPSLASQIQRIYERQMLSHVFPGDPSHGQAFVHIDDVVQAFRLLVEKRSRLADETVLLIGEPVTESYESLQNLMGRLLHGESWATRRIPKPVAATGAWAQGVIEAIVPDAIDQGVEPFIKPFMVWLADDHYELDVSRARRLLDWQPRHRLRAVLPRMIGKLKQDPAAWYARNHIPLPLWLEDLAAQPAPEAQLLAEYEVLDRHEHRQTVWCHFANAALGLWLIAGPFIFGLTEHWRQVGELVAPNGRGMSLFGNLDDRQRPRQRPADHPLRPPLSVAQHRLGALGDRRRRHLGTLRAAHLLDPECRGLCQRYARRRSRRPLCGRHPGRSGGQSGRPSGRPGHAAGMGLQPVVVEPADPDHRPRAGRILHLALPRRFPARPHRAGVGSLLR
jgi:nucleoside-diphosphate-sugar epimerase